MYFRLRSPRRQGKALIDRLPEGGNRLALVIKKVLEEANHVQRWGIRVPLTILTDFTHPVARFVGIDYLEKVRWIEERTALIVQNPQI
jgi:hypothetical protein